MLIRNLSVLFLLLVSLQLKAEVFEYECHKGSDVWEYFYKTDEISDEDYIITFDTENILFETKAGNFYYSINAVDKNILTIIKFEAVKRGSKKI